MADNRRGSSGVTQEDAAKAAHERRREQIRRAQRYGPMSQNPPRG